MIAFGSSISDAELYRRCAEPGIRLAAAPDSDVYALEPAGPTSRNMNLLLNRAAGRQDLEALVLVQEHVEIADRELCAKVRRAFRDPNVAVVGCAGATGVRSIAWWEGAVSCGRLIQRYEEHGGGDMAAFSWTSPAPAPAEVDSVDGGLLVLSPWAVRNLRFDETLNLEYGYDLDFCLRVREAGRRVMTADLEVIRHQPLELIEHRELWVEAHIQVAEKWGGRMPGADQSDGDWKDRARRAEAMREAARTIAYSTEAKLDAQVLPLERQLADLAETVSWRITAPLRRLNHWRSQALRSLRGLGS
jgi:hypothetical protein